MRRSAREDIELLAGVDAAHEVLSGPATRKILQRAHYDFREPGYQRLAELSVAQLYWLRKSVTYRKYGMVYQATRPTKVAIGESRSGGLKADPRGLNIKDVSNRDLPFES